MLAVVFTTVQPPLYSLTAEAADITTRALSSQGDEEKFLETKAMSRRNGPKLDLKLNLSPPRVSRPRVESPDRSSMVGDPMSPPSSCLSSELNLDESLLYSNSPEATSMVLVGCPRCLMYVMLAEEDPKCPKCKSTVLLDVIHQKNTSTSKRTKKI
ncbi:Hypothetical predicted protein [Olea europaea subsp. europaea]|uniref:GIR1-like zinc ribbon domain-containing protein n=2 Tax=Olea europaea subsp. europaea TaxID=158383 RepID=A0A8S0U4H2_OLEEU|nr:Hypothetical predicted protein [Olea europaea subsp. europaea]